MQIRVYAEGIQAEGDSVDRSTEGEVSPAFLKDVRGISTLAFHFSFFSLSSSPAGACLE